MLPLVV